jgi:Ion channel
MDVLFRIIGVILVLLVLFDVFKTVIVPRITSRTLRIAPFLLGIIMWPLYKKAALSFSSKHVSISLLETFAPLSFVVLMMVWLSLMISGFALILFSLRGEVTPHIQHFSEAIYFAGASVLTIGYGDVVASSPLARFTVLTGALCGLIFMALDISFLFTVQNWLQQREQIVNTLSSRAGTPASGLVLLLRYKELEILSSLGPSFLQWESWTASILESHRAYPILIYFRSSNSRESWLSSMGAMLDAASILLTSIDEAHVGEADLFYWLSCTTLESICQYMNIPATEGVYLNRQDYNDGLSVLAEAGYKIKTDDRAWNQFCARRAGYMGNLIAISEAFSQPMHRWLQGLPILHSEAKEEIAVTT